MDEVEQSRLPVYVDMYKEELLNMQPRGELELDAAAEAPLSMPRNAIPLAALGFE